MLYARTATNGFGVIEKPTDVIDILHGGVGRPGSKNASIQMQHVKRVKPAIYTYIISSDDDSFRFSETGAAFFVDFASKHALHSNCAETVRYSGEFHPRPKGGWQNFSDDTPDDAVEWELVIDNNSGTYAPNPMMLPELKELLEYNFPGFVIHAWDREDPRLKESVEACREYATKYRGVGTDELQPTAGEGEVTLMHQASQRVGRKMSGQNIDQEGIGEGRHRRYGSDANAGSASSGGRRASSYAQPLQGHQFDAYASHYSNPDVAAGPSMSPRRRSYDQPPPLPARPSLDGLPRTSSEYLRNSFEGSGNPPAPAPAFPEPKQYILPSTQGRYVALENPSYGYGPSSSSIPQSEPQPPPLPPRPSGPGSRPTSRPTLQDYAALPPGCAPPSRFVSAPALQQDGEGGYCAGQMSRYDPCGR